MISKRHFTLFHFFSFLSMACLQKSPCFATVRRILRPFSLHAHPARAFLLFAGAPFINLILLSSVVGCKKDDISTSHQNGLCIAGSSVFEPFLNDWISHQKTVNDVEIQLTGNGAAPRLLRDGRCDIALLTRQMTDREIYSIYRRTHSNPTKIIFARDAMLLLASKDFPVNSLSMQTVHQIFTSNELNPRNILTTSQLHLSDDNQNITPLGIDSASEEYRWFKQSFLNGDDLSDRVAELPGVPELIENVKTTKMSVGYAPYRNIFLSFSESGKVRSESLANELKILNIEAAMGAVIEPTYKNFSNGSYPLLRELYIYTSPGEVSAPSKRDELVKYILSPKGQKKLSESGFIPLKE